MLPVGELGKVYRIPSLLDLRTAYEPTIASIKVIKCKINGGTTKSKMKHTLNINKAREHREFSYTAGESVNGFNYSE